MFEKILIANRGEIAVRVIKTCRRLGIGTAVVYSDADAGSLAVELADVAVHIGPAPAAQSYLVIDKIIDAVRRTGADAVHPGFGFLSENAAFAQRLAAEGIAFIGPNPRAIEAMGDKITSKKLAAEAGVNVVPGFMGLIETADDAVRIAGEIGFPVMIKASAGGGGKGMRIAYSPSEAREGFTSAKNEARSSFGDDRVFIEKFVEEPRHIEIQVLGDKHGHIVHLGERECSIQRRNQKVIEEAPSPFLTPDTRAAMGEQAVRLARAVGYDSAGTVEFIVDRNRNFYFLEMNTRLQVEHPVTECVTGLDLVEQMIRSAAGKPLEFAQEDVRTTGWALEARVYAEDPVRGFLPSIGRLTRYRPPMEGARGTALVRNDTGVAEGDRISLYYDPMIAKLITHAPSRDEAIETMLYALDRFEISGIVDNIPFLAKVFDQERFRSGALTTGYIKEEFPDGFALRRPDLREARLFAAVATYVHGVGEGRKRGASAGEGEWVALLEGDSLALSLDFEEGGAEILFADEDDLGSVTLATDWRPGMRRIEGVFDGAAFAIQIASKTEGYILRWRDVRVRIIVCRPRAAELHRLLPEKEKPDLGRIVASPMPGLVVSVAVAPGQEVKAGEALLVVEAMKMENIIRAERDGVIKTVKIAPGASVAADEVMLELA